MSIAIPQKEGEKIAALVDNGTKVWMEITVGAKTTINSFSNNINKTSVLFVSISFIVLMIISLAWLVFYYIQRFRYAHAKERLSVSILQIQFTQYLCVVLCTPLPHSNKSVLVLTFEALYLGYLINTPMIKMM